MILESPLGKHVCFTNGHASYDYVILDFINNLDLESTKDPSPYKSLSKK